MHSLFFSVIYRPMSIDCCCFVYIIWHYKSGSWGCENWIWKTQQGKNAYENWKAHTRMSHFLYTSVTNTVVVFGWWCPKMMSFLPSKLIKYASKFERFKSNASINHYKKMNWIGIKLIIFWFLQTKKDIVIFGQKLAILASVLVRRESFSWNCVRYTLFAGKISSLKHIYLNIKVVLIVNWSLWILKILKQVYQEKMCPHLSTFWSTSRTMCTTKKNKVCGL